MPFDDNLRMCINIYTNTRINSIIAHAKENISKNCQ
jgi:hypothetical protein